MRKQQICRRNAGKTDKVKNAGKTDKIKFTSNIQV